LPDVSRQQAPKIKNNYQTYLTTLKISHFTHNLNQLPDLQTRIRLQNECDIAVVSAGEGSSAAVQRGDGAE
jgi:hypothetical protein